MKSCESLTRRQLLASAAVLVLAAPLEGRVTSSKQPIPQKENRVNARPLMILRLTTAPTQEIGATPCGSLSVFPVIGGSFEGDRLRGKVLPGGGDWVIANADGTFEVDLRITLQTDDDALIHMTFSGVRDDKNHYFRTLPLFETGSQKYAFLNRLLAVGSGEIGKDGPIHVIEEIL
jgi:hypothetical protein